jgi:hypothetical protein
MLWLLGAGVDGFVDELKVGQIDYVPVEFDTV